MNDTFFAILFLLLLCISWMAVLPHKNDRPRFGSFKKEFFYRLIYSGPFGVLFWLIKIVIDKALPSSKFWEK